VNPISERRVETAAMDALMVRLFNTIDESNMAWVIAADQALRGAFGAALIDLVPSYTTLLVHYDCQQMNHTEALGLINQALSGLEPADTQAGELHDIPVWYDESVGPELPLVAKRAGLSVDELIKQHCNHDYCVFALGFAPGYGFMGLVDEAIATPRLKTPRRKVAAGSVGIADRQTAIYPLLSPGVGTFLAVLMCRSSNTPSAANRCSALATRCALERSPARSLKPTVGIPPQWRSAHEPRRHQ